MLTSVQASVNHDSTAETLSTALEQISAKVARCAKILHVIKTDSLRGKLAEVYAAMFYFFRDIVEWYHKSRTSRFLGSFNDSVNKKFETTAATITVLIDEIDKEAAVGGFAMQWAALQGLSSLNERLDHNMTQLKDSITDIQMELIRQRQHPRPIPSQEYDLETNMVRKLLENFNEVSFNGWLNDQGIECTISKPSRYRNITHVDNKQKRSRRLRVHLRRMQKTIH